MPTATCPDGLSTDLRTSEPGPFDLLEKDLAMVVEARASLGGGDALRRPLQQWRAEIEFQCLDALAQRRLRHMQRLRSLADALGLYDAREISQFSEVH